MTVEVQSELSPEGEFTVTLLIDQGRRWFRAKPVHLSQQEARQLAYELLEAAGVHYAAVLDNELAQLEEAAKNTSCVQEYEQLVMLRSMVGLMRRMFPEAASGSGHYV